MVADRTFTALVTFERTDGTTEVLQSDEQGACGYMAIAAADEDCVINALRAELSELHLRLVEVEQIEEIDCDNLPDNIDEHLAANIRDWEHGRQTVWGTIHVYLADGEA